MRHRGERQSTLNFFAFQDVMIATIGVILVISLLLILNRATRLVAADDRNEVAQEAISSTRIERRVDVAEGQELSARRADVLALRDELDLLDAQLLDARADLNRSLGNAELDGDMAMVGELIRRRDVLLDAIAQMNRRNRIVYLITDPDDRIPFVVELGDDRVVLSTDRVESAPITLDATDPDLAARLLLDFFERLPDRSRRYLLLSVKPSGVGTLQAIVEEANRRPTVESTEFGLDLIPEWAATTSLFPGRSTGP